MRPGTSERDVEVIAILLRLEAALAGGAGLAIGGDPVAELRSAALKMALGFLGVVPHILPNAFNQPAHLHSPLFLLSP